MQEKNCDFIPRQYMVTPDFEFFHYKDDAVMDIEYHNHDFYEIYFFLAGSVTYLIEGKSYRLKPGDILLISNRELHKPIIEPGEPYERMVVWVNPDFLLRHSTEECNLGACFESSSRKKYNLLRPQADILNNIKGSLARFERACGSATFGSSMLKKLYLIEILVFLNKAFMDSPGSEVEIDIEYSEKINGIIRYINKNLQEDLSLDFLASRFFMSKYYLLHEFKKHVGYSIHQYIRQKRLMTAKQLLRDGLQVTEVCSRCGFGDYSNFIRSFKKAFGVPPKKYSKINA